MFSTLILSERADFISPILLTASRARRSLLAYESTPLCARACCSASLDALMACDKANSRHSRRSLDPSGYFNAHHSEISAASRDPLMRLIIGRTLLSKGGGVAPIDIALLIRRYNDLAWMYPAGRPSEKHNGDKAATDDAPPSAERVGTKGWIGSKASGEEVAEFCPKMPQYMTAGLPASLLNGVGRGVNILGNGGLSCMVRSWK
mmetsp:Transcript_2412/g.6992  ORF Transcript_2412/g.6992 Transcript_2412/m.6992 type:complete len:205 (+) Transcript_2412:2699-3313(+)